MQNVQSQVGHDVVVFHDETEFASDGRYKGHILFIVPESVTLRSVTPMFGEWTETYSPFNELCGEIRNLRSTFRVDRKLHFADISGKKWYSADTFARMMALAATDALRHKRSAVFSRPLHCKMAVLFFSAQTDLSLYGGNVRREKRLRHQETILRMLLKGALHFLYPEGQTVMVRGIVSDGDPFHRKLDDSRIIWQILIDERTGRTPLQSNASFARGALIEQIPSDHKRHDARSIDWDRANLLQLADLLLGSTVRVCHRGCQSFPHMPRLGSEVSDKKSVVAYPAKEMLLKTKRGSGFGRSGHHRSFTVAKVEFVEDEVTFTRLNPLDVNFDDPGFPLPFAE